METQPSLSLLHEKIVLYRKEAGKIILDKDREIALTLCCILARGHLLIEDIPGVGKTTLVQTLSKLLGIASSRIQFTNDLLPADILGNSIFDPDRKAFVFHPGPIFSQMVLADELNRASPKTQSACLQAMEERRVTIDGTTHPLPEPFILIATQNPRQQVGTYPLPESQLDRFLMRIEMGHPSREAERLLLLGDSRSTLIEALRPALGSLDLLEIQKAVREVHASAAMIDYLQDIVARSRAIPEAAPGLSPRAAVGFLQAARAWAFLQGREHVLPEDVQAVAVPVMSHRLNPVQDLSGRTGIRLAGEILAGIAVD